MNKLNHSHRRHVSQNHCPNFKLVWQIERLKVNFFLWTESNWSFSASGMENLTNPTWWRIGPLLIRPNTIQWNEDAPIRCSELLIFLSLSLSVLAHKVFFSFSLEQTRVQDTEFPHGRGLIMTDIENTEIKNVWLWSLVSQAVTKHKQHSMWFLTRNLKTTHTYEKRLVTG